MTKNEVGVYFNKDKSRLHFVYIDVGKLFNGDKSELYNEINKKYSVVSFNDIYPSFQCWSESVNIDKIEYHPESDLVKIVCYVSTI